MSGAILVLHPCYAFITCTGTTLSVVPFTWTYRQTDIVFCCELSKTVKKLYNRKYALMLWFCSLKRDICSGTRFNILLLSFKIWIQMKQICVKVEFPTLPSFFFCPKLYNIQKVYYKYWNILELFVLFMQEAMVQQDVNNVLIAWNININIVRKHA